MQASVCAPEAGSPKKICSALRHVKDSLSFLSEAPLLSASVAAPGTAGVHVSGGMTQPTPGSQTRHLWQPAGWVQPPAALQTSSVQRFPSEVHALPAASSWQVALQQSPSLVLPSSQVSPAVTTPLPQPVGL